MVRSGPSLGRFQEGVLKIWGWEELDSGVQGVVVDIYRLCHGEKEMDVAKD